MSNIATVPSHVAGDVFTAGMWTTLQQDINDGIVNQVCAARVYSTNNFAVTSTFQPVPMNSERYDGDSMHDPADNTKLTCKTAGIYAIGGNLEYPADASSGSAHIGIRLNGSIIIARAKVVTFTGATTYANVSCDWLMAVGDYVELVAAGTTSPVQADGDLSPEFWMHRI